MPGFGEDFAESLDVFDMVRRVGDVVSSVKRHGGDDADSAQTEY